MVRNGFKHGRQCYKCRECGRQFIAVKRLDNDGIKTEYIDGKQTIAQLSAKYGVAKSTIWCRLKMMRHVRVISKYENVVINIDTTYWGRNFGLLAIKDTFRNKVLWYKFVRHDRIADYLEEARVAGVKRLQDTWDHMRRYAWTVSRPVRYPVQMCQFHLLMIIRRYLTNSPELPASQELLCIARAMSQTDRAMFVNELEQWYGRWEGFLRVRTVGKDGRRTTYTYRRLRSDISANETYRGCGHAKTIRTYTYQIQTMQ